VVSGLGSSVKVTLVAPAGMVTEPLLLVKLTLPVADAPVLAWKLVVNWLALFSKSPPVATEGAVDPSRAAAKFTVSGAAVDPVRVKV
jgi:hypothetical protein